MGNTEEKKVPPKKAPPKPPQRPLPAKPAVRPAVNPKQENIVKEEISKTDLDNITTDIKEQKHVKEAEPKPQKQKKDKPQGKKIGKGKKILIALIILLVLVCLGGGVTAWVLINQANNIKLLTPEVSVVQLYNGTIVETQAQDGATKYEYVITDPTGKQSKIEYSSNRLELNRYFNQAGQFSVKIRVFGKGAGATSDYSKIIQFENKVQLSAPDVHVNNLEKIMSGSAIIGYKNNTNIADDTLTWDPIKNASKYYVRYGVDLSTNTVKHIEVDGTSGQVSFNLSKIYEKGTGRYQISVIAVAEDGSYYLNSDYQEVINIEYYAKQDPVYDLAYNKTTKILSFKINENSNHGSEFDLFISYADGTKSHKIYLDQANVSISGGVIAVSCSLSQVANAEILSLSVVTLSDGEYSTDSESVELLKDDFS